MALSASTVLSSAVLGRILLAPVEPRITHRKPCVSSTNWRLLRHRGSALMILSLIAQFQYLFVQPRSQGVVYLIGRLRYNGRHEIVAQEPWHAAEPFGGGFS